MDKIFNLFFKKRNKALRGFDAAKMSRLWSDWVFSATSPDKTLSGSLVTLRERSRDLSRNNPFIRHYLKECQKHVIGPNGINFRSGVKDPNNKPDKQANKKIEDAWASWVKRGNCDVTGKYNFLDIQNLVLSSVIRDGEIFIRKIISTDSTPFKIQLFEADLVDDKYNIDFQDGTTIRMGVEKDPYGKVLAYYILDKHPGDRYQSGTYDRKRIPADEIIHIYDFDRVNSSRGYPWAASAMTRLFTLSAYEEAEVIAARMGACKMGYFERSNDGEGYNGDGMNEDGSIIEKMEPGLMQQLPPGVKFTSFDPNHPNQNFSDFVKAVLRSIASGLGISYNSLANDLEGVNYSSLRAALLEDRDEWMRIQRWFIDAFLEPVFSEWIKWNLVAQKITLPFSKLEKFNSPVFQPRRWAWVDPQKDTQANVIALQNGLKTLSGIIRESGGNPDDVFEEIKNDAERLKSNGLEFLFNSIYLDKQKNGNANDGPSKEDN